MLGSIALPLTNGFVGEFMMLLGIYQFNMWFAIVAGLGMIMGAVYMLFMYQKVMLGETNALTATFTDLKTTEKFVLIPLAVLILLLGVYPQMLINLTESDIHGLINQLHIYWKWVL